jgi:16S rRNA (uracil1498-N3)-methyltransferase
MASAPRFFVDVDLRPGDVLTLPPGASRHAQVLRMQPGHVLTLFNGRGTAHQASVLQMGRQAVQARVGEALSAPAAPRWRVTLAVGMPANDRMDWLVEKATELGVDRIVPLIAERSVLRMRGERADKKRDHWQGVAVAACEQSGRWTVPLVDPVQSTSEFWPSLPSAAPGARWLLSLRTDAQPLKPALADLHRRGDMPGTPGGELLCLSGPEGGLTQAEEDAARHAGFTPVSLGGLTLRAETAPLVVLSSLLAAG